jgi:chromosome segregation ATPase
MNRPLAAEGHNELGQAMTAMRTTIISLQQQMSSNAERLAKTEQQLQQQSLTTERLGAKIEDLTEEWRGIKTELKQSEDNIVSRLAAILRGPSMAEPKGRPNG